MACKIKKLCAGDLKHLVEWQRFTATEDTTGGQTHGWAKVENIWCKIKSTSGREVFTMDQLKPSYSWVFEARFGPDVLEDDRIVFKTDIYEIVSVINVDFQSYILQMQLNKIGNVN